MMRHAEDYLPFEIGRTFRVRPPEGVASEERTDLVIPRGAFGAGEHETTASCLVELEGLTSLKGARCLDLGCGTGILGIAALKLGATEVVGVDTSAEAIEACRRTCALNGVEMRLVHGELSALDEGDFDLVLGNLYGDILLAVAPDLVPLVRPGGTLLLSGILWEYAFDVRRRYTQLGCEVLKYRLLDEFATVLLRRT